LFRRLREDLGLPAVRLHGLRHTSASLMLTAGVHPKVVSERLGHSGIAITFDLYSHVIPGMQADAADKLGAMMLGR
jgi:integrase